MVGIVLAAGYILWMIERTFFGRRPDRFSQLTDASLVEALPLGLLMISILAVGIYPSFLSDVFASGLEPIVAVFNGGG